MGLREPAWRPRAAFSLRRFLSVCAGCQHCPHAIVRNPLVPIRPMRWEDVRPPSLRDDACRKTGLRVCAMRSGWNATIAGIPVLTGVSHRGSVLTLAHGRGQRRASPASIEYVRRS